ncbi:MAG TPA: Wzz/FepE/Etk N-terminal domain-containing protein [Bacillota bacterium]|nr:Wzz/FepE/Etk N-terminal domain-containing protein [Bacillota bacterium]
MKQDTDTFEIDFRQIFRILKNYWYVLVLSTALAATAALIYSTFVATPQYTAKTQVLIKVSASKDDDEITQTMINTAQSLVSTFAVILKSNNVVDTVVDSIPYDYTRSQISSMISASALSGTAVMQIQVTCEDPLHAQVIAMCVREYGIPEIIKIYGAGSVTALGDVDKPTSPSSPDTEKNTLIAAFCGLFLAAAACIVITLLDTKIKTEDDLKAILDVPIIGVIPSLFKEEVEERKHEYSGGKSK